MAHQPIGLEWYIGEEAYQRGVVDELHSAFPWKARVANTPEARLALQAMRWILFAAAALFLASSIGFSPQQEAIKRARSEVGIWMTAAEDARLLDDRDAYETLLDPTIPSNWRREWRAALPSDAFDDEKRNQTLDTLSVDNGLIRIVVTSTGPSAEWWRSSPYRETQFFRPGETGLVRTVPSASFWGERKTVESAHIRLDYYERDARLAESILPRLEVIYLELFELLQLDPDAEAPKATVMIDKEQPRGWASAGRSHTLLSPQLSRIPVALSNEDFMMQQIVSRLSYMALNEALPNSNRSFISQWDMLIWAIDGWMRTELLQQRTPWHLQAEEALRNQPPQERPLKMNQIGSWGADGRREQKEMMRRYMVAESVVAFLIEEHGREQIPRLIYGVTRHGNWSGLVNALYSVPIEELEGDWNRYLKERFGWDDVE